jgi:hypothetical protein
MFYSIIGILAIILHFIINRKALKRVDVQSIQGTAGLKEAVRYRFFLITVTCFYIFDIAWGFLYEHHDIPALFPVIYSTGIFYFIFLFLTTLTWIRYVVAYLDKRRRPSKALLYAVYQGLSDKEAGGE